MLSRTLSVGLIPHSVCALFLFAPTTSSALSWEEAYFLSCKMTRRTMWTELSGKVASDRQSSEPRFYSISCPTALIEKLYAKPPEYKNHNRDTQRPCLPCRLFSKGDKWVPRLFHTNFRLGFTYLKRRMGKKMGRVETGLFLKRNKTNLKETLRIYPLFHPGTECACVCYVPVHWYWFVIWGDLSRTHGKCVWWKNYTRIRPVVA